MAELLFPLQFKRQYSGSLDPDLHFISGSTMDAYKSSPLAYPGMIVSCEEFDGKVFVLSNDKSTWMSPSDGLTSLYYQVINLDGTGTGVTITHASSSNIMIETFYAGEKVELYTKVVDNTSFVVNSNVQMSNIRVTWVF